MTIDSIVAPGRVAVITGAANGIGLAAAERFAGSGMKVCLADVNDDALEAAGAAVARKSSVADVLTVQTDVSRREDVERLKTMAYEKFGEVGFLMSNAGIEGGGGLFADPVRWKQTLDVNLWGAINVVQVFGPAMIAQGTPGAIVTTGSKQGITTPPGDTAYNVSKAGLKVLTEALAQARRAFTRSAVIHHPENGPLGRQFWSLRRLRFDAASPRTARRRSVCGGIVPSFISAARYGDRLGHR